MANALLHRYGPTLFPLDDAARQYRGMTLLELARESLGNAGVNTRGLSRDEVATRALHSTSDFPEILSAVTSKTLRQAYDAYPRTFALFCRQVLATDFKSMHRVQLGEAPQLLEVGESGEFKRGTLGESKESYRVKTYGRVVAITRQVLINDDLDAFTRIPAMYGNSIAQLESDVVWGIITANPAMADGTALFHANHKNLAGTGAALAVDAVGAARAAMALQTGIDKKTVLNIRPAYLIVPAALELKAEQLVAQNLVPAATASVVPQSIGKGRTSLNAAALVWSKAPVIVGAHDTGPLIRSKSGFWLTVPTPAAGKSLRGGKITPLEWERRTGLRLRFVYRRTGPSLLVAEGRLNTKGRAVASRSKTGRGLTTVSIFLLVPQVKLRKRLDLARDAERAQATISGSSVRNWVEDHL